MDKREENVKNSVQTYEDGQKETYLTYNTYEVPRKKRTV